MTIKSEINPERIPNHIAIIMDGNGRWAQNHGKLRTFGHQKAIHAVRDVIESCVEIGVKTLTLYAFSTENWKRPKFEINALMSLLVSTIHKETKTLMDNNIKLRTIGDIDSLPNKCQKELADAIKTTEHNHRMTLVLALSYGSRKELTDAIKEIGRQIKSGKIQPEDIDEKLISDHLQTKGLDDPELLIRTSGEHRISNFLLWQIAYTELYFTQKLWPDFRKEDLYQAILDYQNRERRFGKTSEQISIENQ